MFKIQSLVGVLPGPLASSQAGSHGAVSLNDSFTDHGCLICPKPWEPSHCQSPRYFRIPAVVRALHKLDFNSRYVHASKLLIPLCTVWEEVCGERKDWQ